MARWPEHNDAHEARPQHDAPAGSTGEARGGLRRLRPLADWILGTFSLDRWLVASVAGIAIVAAGVVSTSFLANGPREGIALPALRDPQDVTLVQAEPPAQPEAQVASQPPSIDPGPLPPNRADCEAIRGTPYLSDVERFWFVATCVEQETDAEDEDDVFVASAGGDRPPLGVGGPGPVAEPIEPEQLPAEPTAVSFGPADAEYVVRGWLVYQGYVPADGSCHGTGSANQWLVTCLVESSDPCDGSGCVTLVTACLIPEPRTAWFC